jgi:hypothetical protein
MDRSGIVPTYTEELSEYLVCDRPAPWVFSIDFPEFTVNDRAEAFALLAAGPSIMTLTHPEAGTIVKNIGLLMTGLWTNQCSEEPVAVVSTTVNANASVRLHITHVAYDGTRTQII